MADDPILYGTFSEGQARIAGSVWYSTPDGGEVEVTCVARTADWAGNKWEDKRSVGQVVKFLRRGRRAELLRRLQ